MKTKNAGAKPLNVRQERFADHVVSGMSATQAYITAGYKVSEKVAGSAGPRMMLENVAVRARIKELRAETQKQARKTKAQKLELLEKIAWDETSRRMDVIAALKVHNEMTGDNEPTVTVVDLGAKTLEMVRDRARTIASPLARR